MLLCLVVCLTLLASFFFLLSQLSLSMHIHRAPTTALEDDGCVVLTGHHGNCDNVNFDLGDCSSSSSHRDGGTTEGRGGGEQLGGGEEGGGEVASVPVSLLPQTTRNTNTTHRS